MRGGQGFELLGGKVMFTPFATQWISIPPFTSSVMPVQ
jgi:hypothetical protein